MTILFTRHHLHIPSAHVLPLCICSAHKYKDKYIFTHLVASLVFLLGFVVEMFGILIQLTNKHAIQDQHSLDLTCSESIPVTYNMQTLMQLKGQHTNAKLDIQTKLKIAQLTIKRRFRRKRGGKNRSRYKDSDTSNQSTLLTHWVTDISNHYQNVMGLTEIQHQLLPIWLTFNLYIQN